MSHTLTRINISLAITLMTLFGCKQNDEKTKISSDKKATQLHIPPQGMIWVPTKTFLMGAKPNDAHAMTREKPAHKVKVDGFFMDATEVTNAQFKIFVEATKYVTVAERPIDWEVMKKELPPSTLKPHDSLLRPGSLVFNKNVKAVVNMSNYAQWWTWKTGADWKHPNGPDSNIEGKANFPVVHIAIEDAQAYCKWANRRLPTEAEWESAAQGIRSDAIFTWGNDLKDLNANANTWQGSFPTINTPLDGFKYIAEVKSFPPNSIGVYDMLGNVWEMTSDLFNTHYYGQLDTTEVILNPKGAKKAYNPDNPYTHEFVIKGGSFLCHESYCASFRISARMGLTADSGSDHTGFRTVATIEMLNAK